ncbi:RabGAP/TBC [Cylindrobasidium torrendii FP15055 ss-10]|uniref:RabGAP/TBC n=1 Tax=Cylindrobasidium torrendii FP15055 ss-10 TaxID=1314674 RepID=A0A0D7BID6_9AGAR|nr:RabGAP/TBC [Cylindrobasidium torrendii FP15055 ss-10]
MSTALPMALRDTNEVSSAGTSSSLESSFSALSVSSTESMVEIKRSSVPQPSSSRSAHDLEEDRYRLIYTRSKVYVHPTAYARDNIPGFAAIVKREATNPTYLLAWIPETLLDEKGTDEWDKFVKVEEKAPLDDEDADIVLIDLPAQRPESYAFSVPLTSIYSLVLYPPSFSAWHGSVGINLINGDTLPTLYFHDEESRSFSLPSPKPITPVLKNKRSSIASYPPPASPSISSPNDSQQRAWGGEALLNRLRSYAHVLRSTLQPSLFLIDPSRADMDTHSVQLFDDDAVDDILAQSVYAGHHSPVPAHRRPRPISTSGTPPGANPYSQRSSILHRSMASPTAASPTHSQARAALLQSFSNITRATRHAAQNILSHPLAKPIVPHLPDPVKSLVNANGESNWGSWVEKGGVGEFESARVYLARWARIVAEEGERARRREAQALPSSSSDAAEETSSLGVFELLHATANLPTPKSARNPTQPVNEYEWQQWFSPEGKPKVRVEHMRREVFRRGISSRGKLRKKIWPYLLGVLEWDATSVERQAAWKKKEEEYGDVKNQWCGVAEVFDRPDVIDERHRIDVDCRRTDRNLPLFSIPNNKDGEDSEKQRFSISPNLCDAGAQAPSNEHIDRLSVILLSYNFYEKELGYVQGMSDLCAPIYVVMEADEEMTFWCFVEQMKRMKQNFLRDQSGMKKQLLSLQELIGVMDPELYRHLEKTDGLNLFFCFRWVLIAFKREFPFDDVLRLWEVLWTDYYSKDFVLFVSLAVLESHRDMILRYLVEFDEILKYCNELSMTIELDSTLAQAEVLFLSFAQLVADIDRRHAEEAYSTNQLRNRLGNSPKIEQQPSSAIPIPTLSENLRELLDAEREA